VIVGAGSPALFYFCHCGPVAKPNWASSFSAKGWRFRVSSPLISRTHPPTSSLTKRRGVKVPLFLREGFRVSSFSLGQGLSLTFSLLVGYKTRRYFNLGDACNASLHLVGNLSIYNCKNCPPLKLSPAKG